MLDRLDWQSANDNKRTCLWCNRVISGPKIKRYCDRSCARRMEYSRRDFVAEKAAALNRAVYIDCDLCGKPFKALNKDKKPQRFCSKSCSGKATISIARAHSKHESPLATPKTTSYTVYRPMCICCGSRFTAKALTSKYCSPVCSRISKRTHIDRSERNCPECNIFFTPEYGRAGAKFCDEVCAKKHHRRNAKAKRRALKRSADNDNVNPFAVFDRDGWRCQLCKKKTPRSKRGTYAHNAPELDHIIPLAAGGAHTYQNTQCACRACNSAKGSTPLGQMRLFG